MSSKNFKRSVYAILSILLIIFYTKDINISSFKGLVKVGDVLECEVANADENSIYLSRQLSKCVSNKNDEKQHYNAKNLTVKFISFTAVFAVICLISAGFYKFIQSVL